MEARIKGYDLGRKDNNAKTMIRRNTEQFRQHNGYTGMELETIPKKLDKTSSRNSKHGDTGRPQQSYGYNEAINKMF